jgi:hypothetical protein
MTTTTLPALDGLAQELRLMAGDTMFDDRKRQLTRWATEVESLEAALAVPAQWMPIETAPKGSGADGPALTTDREYIGPPRLLLATAEGIMVGYYDWYYHPWYGVGAGPDEPPWRDHDGNRTYGVTHWMPLPAPPGTAAPTQPFRVLDSADPFCPKCGHNRDTSSVSTIDHGTHKSCQFCETTWYERTTP